MKYFIRINQRKASLGQRKAVQEKLFKLGYHWTNGSKYPEFKYSTANFIYYKEGEADYSLMWSDTPSVDSPTKTYREISFQDFLGIIPDEDPVELPYEI